MKPLSRSLEPESPLMGCETLGKCCDLSEPVPHLQMGMTTLLPFPGPLCAYTRRHRPSAWHPVNSSRVVGSLSSCGAQRPVALEVEGQAVWPTTGYLTSLSLSFNCKWSCSPSQP